MAQFGMALALGRLLSVRRRPAGPTKPFYVLREAGLKQNRPTLPSMNKGGTTMFQAIIDRMYRQFLRNTLAHVRLGG